MNSIFVTTKSISGGNPWLGHRSPGAREAPGKPAQLKPSLARSQSRDRDLVINDALALRDIVNQLHPLS
jgi:hypothetical protein